MKKSIAGAVIFYAVSGCFPVPDNSRVILQYLLSTVPVPTRAETPRCLYATTGSGAGGDVHVLQVNPTTGELTSGTPAKITPGGNPHQPSAGPGGAFLYVPQRGSDLVRPYSINRQTCALTDLNLAAATMQGPFGTLVDPAGPFLYVSAETGDGVTAYLLGADGRPSFLGNASTPTTPANGDTPLYLALHPNRSFLYVAANATNPGVGRFNVNTLTGTLSAVTNDLVSGLFSIRIDNAGAYLFALRGSGNGVRRYAVAAGSGALSSPSDLAFGTQLEHSVFDPASRFFYVADAGGGFIFMFLYDKNTGALTANGSVVLTGASALAMDPRGRFLWAGADTSNIIRAYSIDQTTGKLTSVASYSTGTPARHLGLVSYAE